jgi:uncharacterized protein
MNYVSILFVFLLTFGLVCPYISGAEEAGPRILLFTKSAGFEHSVIKNDDSGTSHVERILGVLAKEMGAILECTKDGSRINAATLENVDVVIFYTSGNLTESGGDGNPAITPAGLDELFAWIRKGGGFLGFHAATDSFRSEGDQPTPYIQMLGAEFVTHGAQFKGTIKKIDKDHPAVVSLPESWELQDEWYLFRRFNKETMHVLALLDPGDTGRKQKIYNIPDYPMIWCSAFGDGRVLYNGMGHREDVWEHPTFKALVKEHILWVDGKGPLDATPNYNDVVPQ